jgi:hypothetical protein
MSELLTALKNWSPVVVPILALLAGTGWLQYALNRRRERRERLRTLLEDFLLPFEGMLKTTNELFRKLRDDRELASLEYHPGRLQDYFSKLPDEDPRKRLWKVHIELLQSENRRAQDLIARFYGRIRLAVFRDACDKFVLHAKQWEAMWTALAQSKPIPAPSSFSGQLYAPQFPSGLEDALQAEIRDVRRLAGG